MRDTRGVAVPAGRKPLASAKPRLRYGEAGRYAERARRLMAWRFSRRLRSLGFS